MTPRDRSGADEPRGFRGLSSLASNLDGADSDRTREDPAASGPSPSHHQGKARGTESESHTAPPGSHHAGSPSAGRVESGNGIGGFGRFLVTLLGLGLVFVFAMALATDPAPTHQSPASADSGVPVGGLTSPTAQPPLPGDEGGELEPTQPDPLESLGAGPDAPGGVEPAGPASIETEERPPAGHDRILTLPQLIYCLSEEIRLRAASDAVDPYSGSQVDQFNTIVDDYNLRCSSFRYRDTDMTTARREAERRRNFLEDEGRSMIAPGSSVAPMREPPETSPPTGGIPSTGGIPANASLNRSGNGWNCNPGYRRVGNECRPSP